MVEVRIIEVWSIEGQCVFDFEFREMYSFLGINFPKTKWKMLEERPKSAITTLKEAKRYCRNLAKMLNPKRYYVK